MSSDALVGTIPQWNVRDRMRKAREMVGVSQQEFAARTGLSRRTVSAIETGEKAPGRKEYNLWHLATGVPLLWLETGAEPPASPDGSGSTVVTHRYHKPLRVIGSAGALAA